MKYPATIHATLALGALAASPYYDINIQKKLCVSACADETPVFSPQFSVAGIDNVGTNEYLINIHVEGTINYIPCGACCCQSRTEVISQNFSVPVYSTAVVSGAQIAVGSSANSIVCDPCRTCSQSFVSDTPIVITITTA